MFKRRRRKMERTNYEIADIIGDSLRGCCRPDDVSGFKDPIEERRFLERNLNQAGEGRRRRDQLSIPERHVFNRKSVEVETETFRLNGHDRAPDERRSSRSIRRN